MPRETIPMPLVAVIICGICGSPDNRIGAVVPGFIVQCPECRQGIETGIVVKCSGCPRMSCADCIYTTYVQQDRADNKPA